MYSIKILELLNLCVEDPKETDELLSLVSIIQSSDYQTIRDSKAIRKPFIDYYAFDKIDGLDKEALKEREELIHLMAVFNDKIIAAIRCGNAFEISKKDEPDYLSKESISETINRIVLSERQTSYTNISEADSLNVFSDNTIRSARKCLDKMPLSVSRKSSITEDDIRKNIGTSFYCVNIEDFNKEHKLFLDYSCKGEQVIEKEKSRKKWHLFFKIAVMLFCFGIVFCFFQYGIITRSYASLFSRIMAVISLMYIIWG